MSINGRGSYTYHIISTERGIELTDLDEYKGFLPIKTGQGKERIVTLPFDITKDHYLIDTKLLVEELINGFDITILH